MMFNPALLGALALLPLSAHAVLNSYSFGAALRIGSMVKTTPFNITSATTTFTPGAPPASQPSGGQLYVWPGLATIAGEFIYASLEQVNPPSCSASGDEWCLTAQYAGLKGLLSGTYDSISGSQPLTLDWTVNSAGSWTSSASINGKVVSTVSVAASHASAFGLANVCFSCDTTTTAQTYTNTKIVLSSPQPSFGSGLQTGPGTTVSGLRTTDGGTTWVIDKVVVPAGATST